MNLCTFYRCHNSESFLYQMMCLLACLFTCLFVCLFVYSLVYSLVYFLVYFLAYLTYLGNFLLIYLLGFCCSNVLHSRNKNFLFIFTSQCTSRLLAMISNFEFFQGYGLGLSYPQQTSGAPLIRKFNHQSLMVLKTSSKRFVPK